MLTSLRFLTAVALAVTTLLLGPFVGESGATSLINVSGTLVTSDGTPVPGYPMSSQGVQTTTDSSGNFTLSGLIAGTVTLISGGSSAKMDPSLVPSSLVVVTSITTSTSVSGLTFTLPPTITVSVSVTDAYGTPVPGATVMQGVQDYASQNGWDCTDPAVAGGFGGYCYQFTPGVAYKADSNGHVSLLMVRNPSEYALTTAGDPNDAPRSTTSSLYLLDGDRSLTIALPSYPQSPRYVAAAPLMGSVTIGWAPPALNGGSVLTGYSITLAPAPKALGPSHGLASPKFNPKPVTLNVKPTVTTIRVGGLLNGVKYTIEVVCVNRFGRSRPSTATVTPGSKAKSTTTLTSSQNPIHPYVTVSYMAQVRSGSSPVLGGKVTFKIGGVAIKSCTSLPVSATGVVTCQVIHKTGGTKSITAGYLGTASYRTSGSAVFKEVVS